MSRRRLVAAAALVALLASCSGDGGAVSSEDEIILEFGDEGGLVGGVRRESVDLGAKVTMIVEGNTDEQVHVHGYDLYIEPEGPTTLEFDALIPGRFEVELEQSGQLLIELTVSDPSSSPRHRHRPCGHGDGGRNAGRCPRHRWPHRSAVAGLAVGVGGWLRRCELLCGARRVLVAAAARRAADGGRPLVDTRRPVIRGLEFITKSIGVFLFGVLMWAAWWGNPIGAVNIAGDALLIWFWVGLQLVSFLFGDVWRMFNPFVTIADSGAWVRAKIRGEEAAPIEETSPLSLWPAVAAIFAYLWFELERPSRRS